MLQRQGEGNFSLTIEDLLRSIEGQAQGGFWNSGQLLICLACRPIYEAIEKAPRLLTLIGQRNCEREPQELGRKRILKRPRQKMTAKRHQQETMKNLHHSPKKSKATRERRLTETLYHEQTSYGKSR